MLLTEDERSEEIYLSKKEENSLRREDTFRLSETRKG